MALIDDLVTAVGGSGAVPRVYKRGEVPKPPQYPYAVVGLTSPDKVNRTANGQASDVYRGTVQYFSRDIDGVLDFASLGDLDGKVIAGRLVERETTAAYEDPDDGRIQVETHTYRF